MPEQTDEHRFVIGQTAYRMVDDLRVDDTKRIITATVASGMPIYRGWGNWGYFEKLNINEECIRILRAGNAPVLLGHDSRGFARGTVVDARIISRGEYDVVECDMNFPAESEFAEEMFKEIKAGTMRNISIGYAPDPDGIDESVVYVEDDGGMGKKEYDFVEFNRFSINEVSFVTVPADNSVGIGRALRSNEQSALISFQKNRSNQMPEQTADAGQQQISAEQEQQEQVTRSAVPEQQAQQEPAPTATAQQQQEQQEPTRQFDASGLSYLAREGESLRQRHNLTKEQLSQLTDIAEAGASVDTIRSQVMKLIDEQTEAAADIGNGASPAAPAIHGDKRFTLSNLVGSLLDTRGDTGSYERGVLDEHMTDEADKWNNAIPEKSRNESLIVPYALLATDRTVLDDFILKNVSDATRDEVLNWKREYAVGSSLTGHFYEEFNEAWFVEALVAKAGVISEINWLSMQLTQNYVGVTETGTVSTYWTGENDARNESASLPAYGNRKMEWHQINARVDITQRAKDQSMFLVGQMVSNMFRDLRRGMNDALINGSGSGDVPLGILNYSSLPTVPIADNGGVPTYQTFTDLIGRVEQANVVDNLADGGCIFMNSRTKQRIKNVPRLTGSTGAMSDAVLKMMSMMTDIDGIKVLTDNNLPTNLTKGTSTNAQPILCGMFNTIDGGMFSGVEMFIDPYSDAVNNQERFYIRQALDFSPRYPAAAIAACVDVVL